MLHWPVGWKPDWIVAVPLAVSLLLYVVGLGRISRRSRRGAVVRHREIVAFLAGWLTLVVALLSPIAVISETLLSVHMTQHELLILVAAPLLALGRPIVPWLWALPPALRVRAKRSRKLVAVLPILTAPAVVFLLHAITLWIWHVPVLYQAAILDDRLHAFEHISFTATACLFWWGLVRGRYGRLGYGTAVFYVFATALHSAGLGALMTLSPAPWYVLYVARAATGVDPETDQQMAGLLMWIPAGVLLTLVALALFAAWLGDCERRRTGAQSRVAAS
jgi:putative membrane protein